MSALPHYARLRDGHLVRDTLGRRWPSGWWIAPSVLLGIAAWAAIWVRVL